MGTEADISRSGEEIGLHDQTTSAILDRLIDEVREMRESFPVRKRTILEQYLFADHRATLEQLGHDFGVSRERIRQVKNWILTYIERRMGPELAAIGAMLARRVGPIVRESDLRELVDELFKGEPPHDPAVAIARQMVEGTMGYDCANGVCIVEAGRPILDVFRAEATALADEVGLTDEHALRASLPDESWQSSFDLLAERCGLMRVSGQLAVRCIKQTRAKAAIIAIGRLATPEEISAESGIARLHMGGLLTHTPGVKRASKSKWGIDAWVEDEYKGIPAEIMQRIEEGGGSTSLERLLEEFPVLFGVKESSVLSTARTPQFVVEDGRVRMAEDSEVTVRDARDVAHGVTEEGWPYWVFRVRRNYFDGYSLASVPAGFADALGCPKNGRIWATVIEPTGCRDVSINWRLTSHAGASVGYILTTLRRLGVAEGDRACLAVVGPGEVAFRRYDEAVGPKGV